jgi:hypothetical protein
MNYPDWAPSTLVNQANLYETRRLLDIEAGREPTVTHTSDVVVKAITNPKMEKVWRSYKKRCFKGRELDEKYIKWTAIQFQLVYGIDIELHSRTKWSLLTTTQKKDDLNRLIDSAHVIESVLRKNSLNVMLTSLLNASEIERATNLMPLHVTRDLFDGMDENDAKDFAFRASRHVLLNCGTVYDVLENLRIKAQSSLDELDASQLVERPNRKNYRTTKFMRNACIWHVNKFGTPLYENVAILTNIFLDDKVTKRTAIDSFRSVKDRVDFYDTWREMNIFTEFDLT